MKRSRGAHSAARPAARVAPAARREPRFGQHGRERLRCRRAATRCSRQFKFSPTAPRNLPPSLALALTLPPHPTHTHTGEYNGAAPPPPPSSPRAAAAAGAQDPFCQGRRRDCGGSGGGGGRGGDCRRPMTQGWGEGPGRCESNGV